MSRRPRWAAAWAGAWLGRVVNGGPFMETTGRPNPLTHLASADGRFRGRHLRRDPPAEHRERERATRRMTSYAPEPRHQAHVMEPTISAVTRAAATHWLTTLCDGKLKRIGLFTGSSSCLHAQLVAVSLEPESSGDAGVGLQPSELGDAAAQFDPCRARLMAPLGEPGEEGAAALAPDQQSTTDQSSYCCPDGRPGDAQAPHQLRFWGMRSPIRYRRCTSRSFSTFLACAYKGIRRSGGSVAGSPRAGHAAVSGHTLMPRNRHIVSAEKDEFILLTYQFV